MWKKAKEVLKSDPEYFFLLSMVILEGILMVCVIFLLYYL